LPEISHFNIEQILSVVLLYWTAHMDFRYIENADNFLAGRIFWSEISGRAMPGHVPGIHVLRVPMTSVKLIGP